MFTFEGKIDKALLDSLWWKFFYIYFKRIMLVALIIAVPIIVLEIYGGYYNYAVYMAVLVVLLFAECVLLVNRNIKVQINRFKETYGKDYCDYKVTYDNDGILVENLSLGSHAKMSYQDMKFTIKNHNIVLFFTKASQMVPAFVSELNYDEKKAFFEFIKSQNKKIKI